MLPKEWPDGKFLSGKGRADLWEALEPLVVPAIVILVGLSAFALGRLSASIGTPGGIFSTSYEATP